MNQQIIDQLDREHSARTAFICPGFIVSESYKIKRVGSSDAVLLEKWTEHRDFNFEMFDLPSHYYESSN